VFLQRQRMKIERKTDNTVQNQDRKENIMAKEKCAVLVYHDFYEHLKDLSFEQKGKLFDAILEYDMSGHVSVELDAVSSMAFKFIKSAIDRDKEAYKRKCEKNSQNGAKGGRPNLEKANGLNENLKKQTDNLKTQKSERFFQKPKKADKENDDDNEKENDKDPLPIEGVIGGDDNCPQVVKTSGRKAGQVFSSFLEHVREKIPDEHIENCFLSLANTIKNEAGILKCTDDWLLTVFNQNGKTNFPAKSLVEYARANFEKYKRPKTMVQGVEATQAVIKEQEELAKKALSPLEYSRDEALKWLKNLPEFWRKKSKLAVQLAHRFNFNNEELENNVDL